MGSLLVVTGPPGSGKSTVSKLLVEQTTSSVLVDGDVFFTFLARDRTQPWLSESHRQNTVVVTAAASATGQFARSGYSTVYDGVVGPWFLATFGAATGLDEFDYVVLLPTVEICVDRVLTRRGHGFRDEAAARTMHAEFLQAELPRRHTIDIGSEPALAIVDRIDRARAAGELTFAVPAAVGRATRRGVSDR